MFAVSIQYYYIIQFKKIHHFYINDKNFIIDIFLIIEEISIILYTETAEAYRNHI